MHDTEQDPQQEVARPGRRGPAGQIHLTWALVILATAQLSIAVDASVANIALPAIGEDLGINQTGLTWISNALTLAFAGFLMLGGRFADLRGRRRFLMIGLSAFALGSLIAGCANDEAMLFAGRAIEGLGMAMAAPAALALIVTTFPVGPKRNRAFAVYAAMEGAGGVIGMIFAGWVTDTSLDLFGFTAAGWRFTLLINVPIAIVAALLARRFLAESGQHYSGQLDIQGAVVGTLGVLFLVFGILAAGDYGWGDTATIVSFTAGAALLGLFAFIESRASQPLLPPSVILNRSRSAIFLVMMVLFGAMYAMFYFLTIFLQSIAGYSTLQTGLAFTSFPITFMISAALASQLVNHFTPRLLAGVGTLLIATALYGFSRISVDASPADLLASLTGGAPVGDGLNYWTSVFPYLALMAFGMGIAVVPLNLSVVHQLRFEHSGIGSGVLVTTQQMGGAMGLAILVSLSTRFASGRSEELASAVAAVAQRQGMDPSAGDVQELTGGAAYYGSFTVGMSGAFLVAAGLVLASSAIIWLTLNVRLADAPHTMPTDDNHRDEEHVSSV